MIKTRSKNKIFSEITKEQIKLLVRASQHSKFPLSEDETIEAAIQT